LQDCVAPAKSLLYRINSRQPEIMADVVISIIKVITATCRYTWPVYSSS